MFLKRVKKIKNIFKYFKNPVAVIKFLLSRKKIDKPFFIIPKNGNSIKIGRSSDGWIINKILGGEKIVKISEQILINGSFLREGTSDTFIYKEIFLDECYKKCLDFVNRHSVIIDIGAYIGLFACYVAPWCEKVYAYEPVIENYNQALKNVKNKNIYLFNSAVWSTGGALVCEREGNVINIGHGQEKMAAVTLEDIFKSNNIEKCDLLKMDIEGCEYDVLFSTPMEIFSKIGCICMEFHPDLKKKRTLEDLIGFLKQNFLNVHIDSRYSGDTGILYAYNKNL